MTIDAYPRIEHLALIEDITLGTGGPGLNLAIDLRRLGPHLPVDVVGAVGDDAHGEFLLAECRQAGVGTGAVRRLAQGRTSFTDAMIERDGGRRTFFHHVGANEALDPGDVDLAASTARVLHVGAPGLHPLLDAPAGDGSGNGWSGLLAAARDAGLRTNLEMVDLPADRQRDLVLPCLEHLDSIVVNELEAGSLTRIEAPVAGPDAVVNWAALEASASRLIELGVQDVAVIHFPAGAVAATRGGRTYRQGSVRLPRAQVRSTIGAGDAMAAGVVYGLHEGWDVQTCLRLGVTTAAACLRGATTSDGILSAQQCLALGTEFGFRLPD